MSPSGRSVQPPGTDLVSTGYYAAIDIPDGTSYPASPHCSPIENSADFRTNFQCAQLMLPADLLLVSKLLMAINTMGYFWFILVVSSRGRRNRPLVFTNSQQRWVR